MTITSEFVGPPASVGIDVGGTKCLGVALDADGHLMAEIRIPTPNDPDRLVRTLADIAAELGAVDSFGIGVPGLVDRDGTLLAAPNLTSVRNLRLRDLLTEASGLRVVVDNDNTVACLAEWRHGAGRGFDDIILVGIGTGIGGGFVLDGKLQHGHHGFAGEFGHMVVDPNGPLCPCGQRGCWERFASGHGLADLGRIAARSGLLPVVLAAAGDPEHIRGEHIGDAARAGDQQSLDVITEFGGWVALGLANLTNIFDPGRIVISGGVSDDADLFLGPIQESFRSRLFGAGTRPIPEVHFAELGRYAGAIGAALLTHL